MPAIFRSFRLKGDTIVGKDVWFGRESVVMPDLKESADSSMIAAYSIVLSIVWLGGIPHH